MTIQPYLFFDGRGDEAIEFYKKALGAEVEMLLRFKEAPEQPPPGTMPPGTENKIMHATLKVRDARILASDGHCAGKAAFQGFGLALTARDPADAAQLFKALSDGGTVQMPLAKTFFSPSFGMVADRFGVMWMVIVEPAA